jgi:hypothetical protein
MLKDIPFLIVQRNSYPVSIRIAKPMAVLPLNARKSRLNGLKKIRKIYIVLQNRTNQAKAQRDQSFYNDYFYDFFFVFCFECYGTCIFYSK